MSRRQLPSRSTRGKKPQLSSEQKDRDDALYNTYFNNSSFHNEQDQQRNNKKIQIQMYKSTLQKNIIHYPYPRSYHYFFSLQEFQRFSQKQSYVIDMNRFSYTYPSDNKKLTEQLMIGEVINRNLIGLAKINPHQRNRIIKSKNICHSYLQQTEDRKYHINRYLYQYKYILKNLQNFIQNNKIKQFKLIQQDYNLEDLKSNNLTLQQKQQLLKKKIQILQDRKNNLWKNWYNDDMMYYYHSLDQLLHNKINQLKNQIKIDNIIRSIFSSYEQRYLCKNQISNIDRIKQLLHQLLFYYQSKKCCINQSMITMLVHKYSNKLFSETIQSQTLSYCTYDNFKCIFPLKILNFGCNELQKYANILLALKLNNLGQNIYYLGKSIWNYIFQKELQFQKENKYITFQQYSKIANKKIDQLKKYQFGSMKQKQQSCSCKQIPLIDNKINFKDLSSNQQKLTHFFQYQNKININAKQYICIILYHWFCIALSKIQNYLKEDSSILDIIGSEYYSRFNCKLVQAVGLPEIGILNTILDSLGEVIMRPNPIEQLPYKLYFDFSAKNGVGLIWNEINDENDWQEVENHSEQQNQSDIFCSEGKSTKKIKQ